MPDQTCQCTAPGSCSRHGREVTSTGLRICQRGDAHSIAVYFGPRAPSGRSHPRSPAPEAAPPKRVGDCAHLGELLRTPDGRARTRDCPSCQGTVRLKMFACQHPGHAANPTTTAKDCKRCGDFEPAAIRIEEKPMPMGSIPVAMVAPGQKRPVWRGGIIQIMVTRACDLSCHHCTQGSNLAGRPVVMTPDEFETAVDSLAGYWGVIGTFGGNPTLSPHFGAYCEILRAKVPFEQRGLWCNHPRGKGALCRITFNPKHSNLNCHLSGEAHAEFARDWPESIPYLKGMDQDSTHGSPWVALKDVVPDEDDRWRLIGECDINRYWSALVGVVPGRGLRAYFCEVAYSQAALHATASDSDDWPDVGMEPVPGWWRRPMADFAAQVRRHCHACGVPLRRPGQLAIGGEHEEFSETHRALARPKVRDRMVEFVGVESLVRSQRPATEYLSGVTPGYRGA